MGSYLVTDKVEINSQSVDLSMSLDDVNELANPDIDLDSAKRVCTNGDLNDGKTKGYKKWVDIAEATVDEDGNPFDASKGDGTYLLEFEMQERFPNEISGFISNKGQQIVVKTPEFATKDQIDFISDLFNKVEKVVYDPNSTLEDINKVIDVDSFIKVYFVQELSKNLDSCQTSHYLYYDSKIDGRLHAAPLWDYDMAYAQSGGGRYIAPGVIGYFTVTSDWLSKIKGIYGNDSVLNLQAAVMSHSEVWQRMKVLWNGPSGLYNITNTFLNDEGEGNIPDYIEEIRMTAKMNDHKWDFLTLDLLGVDGTNDTGDTYDDATDYFTTWTTERLNWMHAGDTNTTHLLMGDLNGDGIMNIRDATELQKVLAKITTYDDQNSYCDTNNDNKVNIRDVAYIQMICAGLLY
jgi:hypothetical protein